MSQNFLNSKNPSFGCWRENLEIIRSNLFFLQRRKLRFTEEKQLAQGHTDRRYQMQNRHSDSPLLRQSSLQYRVLYLPGGYCSIS